MPLRNFPLFLSDSVSSRVSRALRKATSKKLSAFTLAELIVVIAILAVLATIGFLSLSEYAGDARVSASKTNVRSIYSLISAESAANSVSPRYYVLHDPSVALSGTVSIVFGSSSSLLVPGPWGQSGANYSAGTPDFAKLKLDPEEFKVSSLGDFFPSVSADSGTWMFVAAADVLEGTGSEARPQFFLQSAALLEDGTAFVVGNYVPPSEGSPEGLIADPSGTGALVDGTTVSGDTSWVPDESSEPPVSCDSGFTLDWGVCKADCSYPSSGVHSWNAYGLARSGEPFLHGTSVTSSGSHAFGPSPANGTLSANFEYSCNDGVVSVAGVLPVSGECASGYAWNSEWTTPACVPNPACGAAHGVWAVSAPVTGFCSEGTTSAVTANAADFVWTCSNHPSAPSSCSAPRQYVVTFDANGGSTPSPASKTVGYGEALGTLPEVSRTGYSFNGWFTEASGGESVFDSMTVTGAFTAHAQWTQFAYVVSGSFWANANGATVSVCGSNVTADASGNFSRTGIPHGTACNNVTATRTNYTCTTTTNGPASLTANVTNVAGGCVANTKTFTCAAKPATWTDWNTVSSYLQTWNGSAWTPSDSTTAYDATASTTGCRYKCASGYLWNGSSCAVSCQYATITYYGCINEMDNGCSATLGSWWVVNRTLTADCVGDMSYGCMACYGGYGVAYQGTIECKKGC